MQRRFLLFLLIKLAIIPFFNSFSPNAAGRALRDIYMKQFFQNRRFKPYMGLWLTGRKLNESITRIPIASRDSMDNPRGMISGRMYSSVARYLIINWASYPYNNTIIMIKLSLQITSKIGFLNFLLCARHVNPLCFSWNNHLQKSALTLLP